MRHGARPPAQNADMNGASPQAGTDNVLRGEFGEAWLKAVAAGCGVLQGRPATLDLQKADVQLTMPGSVGAYTDATVQVQVKTTEDPIVLDGTCASFAVDRATYDALRTTNRVIRRVLAVIWLEKDGDRIRLKEDGTLLVGHAAWVSLEGLNETENVASVTVKIPLANSIDDPGLRAMLEEFGRPRSTVVPARETWIDR